MKRSYSILILLIIFIIIILAIVLMPFLKKKDFISATKDVQETQKIETEEKVSENADSLKIPSSFKIGIFAKSLGGGARDLEFSPEGILLVSIPSKGEVMALPDKEGDGLADEKKVILANLEHPHGLAFFEGKLYVAEKTRVARYNWDGNSLKASLDKVLFSYSYIGGHITRSIAFNKNGQMFISIGSSCNVCFEKDPYLASVIVSDKDGQNLKFFAKGLRNAVFMTINPQTGELWATDMGRDNLGDEIPPDEVNIIKEGGDYGWPNCFGDRVLDKKFNPSGDCKGTQEPTFKVAAHSAPLGLSFINSVQFPKDWQNDLLVAYHGSWNRSTPSGYKVVRLQVSGDKIVNEEDFITGFSSTTIRPVDILFDQKGSLFISDDKGGKIYKVIKKSAE